MFCMVISKTSLEGLKTKAKTKIHNQTKVECAGTLIDLVQELSRIWFNKSNRGIISKIATFMIITSMYKNS